MRYKRRKGTKTIQSKKKEIDGIKFDSTLESFMYSLLKANNIANEYEGEKFVLIESFKFSNASYERTAKKPMVDRASGKAVRGITYTPDFVDPNGKWIIETKGYANESFPLRWKLFKKVIHNGYPNVVIFKPQRQSECDITVNRILELL